MIVPVDLCSNYNNYIFFSLSRTEERSRKGIHVDKAKVSLDSLLYLSEEGERHCCTSCLLEVAPN